MENQKSWIILCREYLKASFHPIPHEINELDWKLNLSEDKEQLSHHLSAFANQEGGGFLVFGITKKGEIHGVDITEVREVIEKLGNIARDALEVPQKIDHFVDQLNDHPVLMIYIPESSQKPVHLRGKGIEHSYLRSGGQTRKMSRHEIANAVLSSRQVRYEELEALPCERKNIFELLNYEKLFQLLTIDLTGSEDFVIDQLVNQKLIYRSGDKFSIANLGSIVAARDMRNFFGKEKFPVRVIKYRDASRIEAETEREFFEGYGVGFQDLIKYIMAQLPTSEIIKDALRKNVPLYPEITVRELVANALIHRDFSITGTNPMIEIFSDRMEILSPGVLLPSVKIERIIDTAPESRNEILASLMRRMGICEERGSGIDKALFAVELYGLPPVQFINGVNVFKSILFKPRHFKEMSQEERIRACYQHCCLKYVSSERMTNASFRTRLGLKDSQYAITWKVIDTAMEEGLIKLGDSTSKSRKFAYYIPFWA